MSFMSRLTEQAHQADSLLCVGLDPHPRDLDESKAEAARDFCLRLIDATAGLALAYKPNAAFFELYGAEGCAALRQVIDYARQAGIVILDSKRGDIASTAEAYAQAGFETYGANALTVNPYLGRDAVEPFLRDPNRGVFLLCKTSNPGSGDLQDLQVVGEGRFETLYERVAGLAERWNDHDNLGLVVGATHPAALERVRLRAPNLWILAPGVGAQGGELETCLQAGLRKDGLGLLIPVSRSLARAADPRLAANDLREQINQFRSLMAGASHRPADSYSIPELSTTQVLLADKLLDSGCVKFGSFTLKSGLQSPIYIDLRRLAGFPHLLIEVAEAYISILRRLSFERLAGLPYAALPIATAISLQSGWPLIYPRKETKTYGTKVELEGVYWEGERAVVVDDLATTGGSKFEAIQKLAAAGLQVHDVVVLIDRQSGAEEALARSGYQMHAVLNMTQMLDHWQQTGRVSNDQIEAVRRFLIESGRQ